MPQVTSCKTRRLLQTCKSRLYMHDDPYISMAALTAGRIAASNLEGINILALGMDGSELAPAGVVGLPSHAAKTLLEADGLPWYACMPWQCRVLCFIIMEYVHTAQRCEHLRCEHHHRDTCSSKFNGDDALREPSLILQWTATKHTCHLWRSVARSCE